jgi:hypothetical protein
LVESHVMGRSILAFSVRFRVRDLAFFLTLLVLIRASLFSAFLF